MECLKKELFLKSFLTKFKKEMCLPNMYGNVATYPSDGRATFFICYRECSSAGEHMTEDHGVGGSTPPIPILFLKVFTQTLKTKLV